MGRIESHIVQESPLYCFLEPAHGSAVIAIAISEKLTSCPIAISLSYYILNMLNYVMQLLIQTK